jgi:hypothetical protein
MMSTKILVTAVTLYPIIDYRLTAWGVLTESRSAVIPFLLQLQLLRHQNPD